MDEFTQQYFETALWSSSDESDDQGGEPLDKNYDIRDFDPATRDKMIADCADFQERFGVLIDEGGGDYGLAGHDFWLTRNGHGAGFWDGDWPEPQATKLTNASKEYGEFYLYLGDPDEDGERLIYGPPPGAYGVREHGGRPWVASGRGVVRAPIQADQWRVQAGRYLYFGNKPFVHLDKESTETAPVTADGTAYLIAELFNQNGVTPDTIYERHMGHAPRARRHR